MFEDIIEYQNVEECCGEMFGFSDVIFKRDFGPWKKDDQVNSIWFDTESSKVSEQDENGQEVKSCKFKLEAVA